MLETIPPLIISSSLSFTKLTLLAPLLLAVFAPPPGVAQARPGVCTPAPSRLSAWLTFEEPHFSKAGTRIAGIVGSAIRLDGASQYYELPPATKGLAVGSEDFSIELWLRTTEKTGVLSIVDKRDATPRGYLVYLQRGRVGFQVANGPDRSDSVSRTLIADGRWHHIVAVCRRLPPQPLAVYVDGELQARNGRSATLENLDVDTPLWIGRHHRNALVRSDEIYLAGDIDELTVYRRALDLSEAAALFKAGSRGKCRPSKR